MTRSAIAYFARRALLSDVGAVRYTGFDIAAYVENPSNKSGEVTAQPASVRADISQIQLDALFANPCIC